MSAMSPFRVGEKCLIFPKQQPTHLSVKVSFAERLTATSSAATHADVENEAVNGLATATDAAALPTRSAPAPRDSKWQGTLNIVENLILNNYGQTVSPVATQCERCT